MSNEKRVNWLALPWLLLWLLPATSVVAGLSTLAIALLNQDDMVTDDYYKKGMSFNRLQQADQRAKSMGLKANGFIAENQIVIMLAGNDVETVGDTLQLKLFHPTQEEQDQHIELRRVGPFQFQAQWSAHDDWRGYAELSPEDARWRLRGQWQADSINLLQPEVL